MLRSISGVRSLSALAAEASSARVLDLATLAAEKPTDEDYAAKPMFLHPVLNRAILVKHNGSLIDSDPFAPRRLGATKVIFPFDVFDLDLGGQYMFVDQADFLSLINRHLDYDEPDQLERDVAVLRMLDKLPTLDPFLVRGILAHQQIDVGRCYYRLTELDRADMMAFVVGEMHRSWLEEVALRESLKRANDELEAKVAQRTRELQGAKEAAERASRAKGAFLASMSHEIRTPLHAILGLSEVLRREVVEPVARERLALVTQASDHLLALINNVLDISKIESGKFELAAVEMRIGDVFARVLAMLHEEARRKGLALTGELDVDASRRVIGDPTRLVQVLLNFAANAIKFTRSGAVTLRCRALEGGAPLYRFEIQDSGPGVPEPDKARIFEPFEQVASTMQRAPSGSGLGLAINRYLVRAMGGEVGLHSEPGAGSLFWFTARLPAAPAAGAQDAPEPADGAHAAEHLLRTTFAGSRVLVVDDNEVNRIVARAQLGAVGLEPDDAVDGLQALERVAHGVGYDIILMDVHMPQLDGMEATRRIRSLARYRDTPIIALTADAFSADRERFLAAGMSDHLPKPLQARQLYEMLVHWLAKTAAAPRAAA